MEPEQAIAIFEYSKQQLTEYLQLEGVNDPFGIFLEYEIDNKRIMYMKIDDQHYEMLYITTDTTIGLHSDKLIVGPDKIQIPLDVNKQVLHVFNFDSHIEITIDLFEEVRLYNKDGIIHISQGLLDAPTGIVYNAPFDLHTNIDPHRKICLKGDGINVEVYTLSSAKKILI